MVLTPISSCQSGWEPVPYPRSLAKLVITLFTFKENGADLPAPGWHQALETKKMLTRVGRESWVTRFTALC